MAQNIAAKEETPFLYRLVLSKLQGNEDPSAEDDDDVEDDPADALGNDDANLNVWVSTDSAEAEPSLQTDEPNPPT
ncbi:hypothetical protein PCASD_23652 [Puccinia coronata f. sp. avenae]|jgi:hypothetical protein|uniref:Uncharacterized protein n=1 Tax=Puccinia coronata f. sp. avenae TaxID=200324 RepID=A0A2N5SV51_9BASI|nr:hypothetical protein PCASD_23652 [Puccinia coronata f. sp. avenae]